MKEANKNLKKIIWDARTAGILVSVFWTGAVIVSFIQEYGSSIPVEGITLTAFVIVN